MRLKVSPKIAINKIDFLVKKGQETLDLIEKEDDDIGKIAEEDYHLNYKTNSFFFNSRDTDDALYAFQAHQEAMGLIPFSKEEKEKRAKEIKEREEEDRKKEAFEEKKERATKNWKQKYNEWFNKGINDMQEIFLDYIPTNLFQDSFPAPNEFELHDSRYFRDYKIFTSTIEHKLEILREFYSEISKNIKSPLIYLPEKAQICFYDFVVPLKPDTNEALLCEKIFEYGIGDLVEEAKIIEFIFGNDFPEDKDLKSIKHAIDGVNRKTNKNLGFSLLKHSKGHISIIPPKAIFR